MTKYQKAIAWIANNDEPGEFDALIVSYFISVSLVADLFNKTPDTVARDVLEFKTTQRSTT
jgi:hypothetical protein